METPLLGRLIQALQCMPGIGKKSAQRIAYNLLEQNRQNAKELAKVLMEAMEQIDRCQRCRNFSETGVCEMCEGNGRDASMLCIVESPSDMEAIEESKNYRGRYFILLGQLSPLNEIGPEDIGLDKLDIVLQDRALKEVILATNATTEGEATAHFISEMAKAYGHVVSRIAYGVPVGSELEYLNSTTISLALNDRKAI